MEISEQAIVRLALLTKAAWTPEIAQPLSRPMFLKLLSSGALDRHALCRNAGVENALYDRAESLLSRVAHVAAYLHVLEMQGYDILLPDSDAWPPKLHRLGAQMPQFLILRGNPQLLMQPKVAIAGSRSILKETRLMAEKIGDQLAQEGYVMISGGAWGVDDAAQSALIKRGGSLILVPAVPVSELLFRHAYLSDALQEGRLLLLLDALPEESFSAQKALSRNHTIYAMGEAAIVVASRVGRGGSWKGAMDCINGGYTPVYVPDGEHADLAGNKALLARGAYPFCAAEAIKPQLDRSYCRQMDLFS